MSRPFDKIQKQFAKSVRASADCRLWYERSTKHSRSAVIAALAIDGVVVFHSEEVRSSPALLRKLWPKDQPWNLLPGANSDNRLIEDALELFQRMSINDILKSPNAVLRGLGLLDSRTSATRLMKIDVRNEPAFVQAIYRFRCKYENIKITEHRGAPQAMWQPRYERSAASKEPLVTAEQVLKYKKRVTSISRNLSPSDRTIMSQISRRSFARIIHSNLPQDEHRNLYITFLRHVQKRSKLLSNTHIAALVECFKERQHWIRPIESWRPASANRHKQFHSLLQHLFAKYDTPAFMDNAWFSRDAKHHLWFMHMGNGASLRNATNMPFRLTKKTIHILQTAPDYLPVSRTFRYAQAQELGADHQMAHYIATSQLALWDNDEEFVLSVIRFFARNDQIEWWQLRRALEYIWNQKYEGSTQTIARGLAVNHGPAQPQFTMAGRTPKSLMRLAYRWRSEQFRLKHSANFTWKRSGIPPFRYTQDTEDSRGEQTWTISELLTGAELVEEGNLMHHCVGGYVENCAVGNCSIFSMKPLNDTTGENRLTIEVDLKDRRVDMVRGKFNRVATLKESGIVRRWAQNNGLRFEYDEL